MCINKTDLISSQFKQMYLWMYKGIRRNTCSIIFFEVHDCRPATYQKSDSTTDFLSDIQKFLDYHFQDTHRHSFMFTGVSTPLLFQLGFHDSVLTSYTFFISTLFSTQLQCSSTFPWIEHELLLRRYLIRRTIIILRHILYSV